MCFMQWSLTADGTIHFSSSHLIRLAKIAGELIFKKAEVKQNYKSEPFVTIIRKQAPQKEAILSFNDKPITHG